MTLCVAENHNVKIITEIVIRIDSQRKQAVKYRIKHVKINPWR